MEGVLPTGFERAGKLAEDGEDVAKAIRQCRIDIVFYRPGTAEVQNMDVVTDLAKHRPWTSAP